MQHRII